MFRIFPPLLIDLRTSIVICSESRGVLVGSRVVPQICPLLLTTQNKT